jgi:radical SAM protein with 4Fe4S-binding SPASM domain
LKNKTFTIISQENRRKLRGMLPLAKPLSLFIETTNLCNFRCTCCGHGNPSTRNDLKPLMNMSMELFTKIISELKDWKGNKLKLLRLAVLGEPFVHPQILEMIKTAKDADIADTVDIFSNGSLLTEEISSKLIEFGLDRIRFSIYSVLPDRHKEVTQTNFDVLKIRDNIKRLRELRDSKSISKPFIFVKAFDTYGEENNVFTEMYKDIADEVDFENVNDATLYNGNNLIKAFFKDREIENKVRTNFKNSLNTHRACPRPFMALVINSNGDVLMCTHDYPKATKIDNVRTNRIRDVWEGKELFEFRKMLLEDRRHENRLCKNCDWFKLFPPEDNVDGLPVEMFAPKGKRQ